MKIKLGEASLMKDGLNELLEREIPAKVSYWLARFLEKVNKELTAMDKARMNLVNQYADKDKDGKPIIENDQYKFSDNNMAEFTKEFNELLDEEFDIDFKPIKIDSLGDIKLKPITLVQLAKIIVE